MGVLFVLVSFLSCIVDPCCRSHVSVLSLGRKLMKKFEHGAELAKDMGVSEDTLKAAFDDYNQIVDGKKQDPYGKRFFQGSWRMNDTFYVAVMEAVLHYTVSARRGACS